MSEPLKLSSRLDLSAASDLKTSLVKVSGNNVILDFSEVKVLGALCLQVIIAASRAAKANDLEFSLINLSERVEDQLRIVGVTPQDLSEGAI